MCGTVTSRRFGSPATFHAAPCLRSECASRESATVGVDCLLVLQTQRADSADQVSTDETASFHCLGQRNVRPMNMEALCQVDALRDDLLENRFVFDIFGYGTYAQIVA